MTYEQREVIIVGGGPAGLAAAVRLKSLGVDGILILEREKELGGILRQCIHDGFGLTRFKEALSGPEYAQRFKDEVDRLGIEYVTDTTVIEMTKDKTLIAVSKDGLNAYKANAIVLSMGCRERTHGAISIPGTRPAGVYTAGVAQAYMNLKNIAVGSKVVILGSGDIGLIMARRITLEGGKVQAVFELQPYPSGLPRNIEQCLNDYQIPLFLSHTVTDIRGFGRLEGITVSEVDSQFKPIKGTEKDYECDTLILSVGLIPENELSLMAGVELDERTKGPKVDENFQTSVPGIFAAGNVLQVHDLVDFVSLEAEKLAQGVAAYIRQETIEKCDIPVVSDDNFGYTVPQYISSKKDFTVSMRVRKPFKDCTIQLQQGDKPIRAIKMKKAIPAELIQIPVKYQELVQGEALKVVMMYD
jgi:thioredoxin reductase